MPVHDRAGQTIGITACPEPFSISKKLIELPEGRTVQDILAYLEIPQKFYSQLAVWFDDQRIDPVYWSRIRPKAGVRVIVKIIPRGDGNNFLRTFLFIAVAVVAMVAAPHVAMYIGTLTWTAPTAATIAASQAGIFAVGALAVNALVPVSNPKFEDNGSATSPLLSVGASTNRLARFSTMPCILGRHLTFPTYAALPYTEIVGQDQYLRLLFVVGYRQLNVYNLKLGENLLTSYDEVEYQILCGGDTDFDQDGNPVTAITLYPNQVNEVPINQKLLGPGSPVEQTTELGTDECSIDLTYPGGLIRIDRSGDRRDVTVTVTFEYKEVSQPDTAYVQFDSITVSAQNAQAIRRGTRFKFPARGQYTVRTTRTTDDLTDNGTDTVYQDDVFFSTFRSITDENPVLHTGAALIAIRIKSSDQLNGQMQDFNCVAHSLLPDYDSVSGNWIVRETSNPASIYRNVLEGRANARPLTLSSLLLIGDGSLLGSSGGGVIPLNHIANTRLDLAALEEWHGECAAANREFNMVRDFKSTVYDTLRDVASAGRGRVAFVNGKWSVVRDKEQTTIVQHFTPRNSWNFSGSKNYYDLPHGFRVRFLNKNKNWENDERIVYDDNFDETNSSRFETLELSGVTDPDQVWSMARYHIAVARLRPETFSFECDIEGLAITQGDMFRLSHDSILVGLGAGRVKSRTDNGTHVLTITIDDKFGMETGKNYNVRHRASATGSSGVNPVNTVAGEHDTFTFTNPVLIADAPSVGDLVMYGEAGLESMELIADSIIPGRDLSATIKAFSYNAAIYQADTGIIPPFDSMITDPPGASVPVVTNLVSDESVLIRNDDGTLSSRIVMTFGFLNNRVSVATIEVQYRLLPAAAWQNLPVLQGDTISADIYPVVDGGEYHIRARYRYLDGTLGPNSEIITHTVIGKTSLPPDVDNLLVQRLSDGTREFRWTLADPPPDLAGFRIKWHSGLTGADWATNMTDMLDGPAVRRSLADGLVAASPWETNQLAAGDYQLAIKAVDTGGRESANARFVTSSLDHPRYGNALAVVDEFMNGWPSVSKTGCFVEPTTGFLIPDTTDTWASLPSTWQSWTSWNLNPVSPMIYQTDMIDIGGIVPFEPVVCVCHTSGTATIEEQHSNDGFSWSAWAVAGPVVTGRFVRIRVTITNPPVDGLRGLQIVIAADTVTEEIVDLNTNTVSAPAGDFRVPITKAYGVITSVQMALQNTGPGWSWELVDKNPTLGPRLKIYDNTNTLADAVVDIVVKGI